VNAKKILTVIGACGIIFFIGWFYLSQLGSLDFFHKETVKAKQLSNTDPMKQENKEKLEKSLIKMDTQGAVGVEVTLLPDKSTSNELIFEVTMNTHSVDLLQYKLNELAHISFGAVENHSGEFHWEVTSEDSHHLVGLLKWKGSVSNDSIVLGLEGLDGVPLRIFSWDKSVLP